MSHAMLFQEGEQPGYLLVKTINEGTQGQVMIVRSVSDGNLYIRKKFIPSMHTAPSEETTFYHHLPTCLAPALIVHTEYGRAEDSIIYSFCNGGSLTAFFNACKKKDKVIAEALFWELSRQICEVLALTHSGWTPKNGYPETWKPIIHADIHDGNVFLHWPDETSPFPRFLLGDWALAYHIEDHKTTRQGRWRRLVQKELFFTLRTLKDLNFHRSQDVEVEDCPLWHFQRLWDEAKAIELKTQNFSIAQYIAENIGKLADAKISRLQRDTPFDFRWTKPCAPSGVLTFGDDKRSPDAAFKEWARMENKGKEMIKPWVWLEVDEEMMEKLNHPKVLVYPGRSKKVQTIKKDETPIEGSPVAQPKKKKAVKPGGLPKIPRQTKSNVKTTKKAQLAKSGKASKIAKKTKSKTKTTKRVKAVEDPETSICAAIKASGLECQRLVRRSAGVPLYCWQHGDV